MLTRIAHLSDVHMLSARAGRDRARHSLAHHFLSIGRPLDSAERRKKMLRALRAADRCADHVVVTGDLTETGQPDEYEAFAGALADARIAPERLTLVPGNHDAYGRGDAWRRALEGPLAPWREGAARAPGHVVDRDKVVFLPLDFTVHQHVVKSGGEVTLGWAEAIARRLDDPALKDRPVVLAMHHPPFSRGPALEWIDGLRGYARIGAMIAGRRDTYVLHGHLHFVSDRAPLLEESAPRVFGATAVVEDGDVARVRLYEVREGTIASAGMIAA